MTRENEDTRSADGASPPGAEGTPSPGAIGAYSPTADGTSSSGATGASSPEVDESTPPTSPGVASAAHKLRVTRASTRANANTEDICYGAPTDHQLRGNRTLMPAKGPPGVNLAVGSQDFAHDDGEPLLASTALMYATGGLTDESIAEEKQECDIIPNKYEDATKSRLCNH